MRSITLAVLLLCLLVCVLAGDYSSEEDDDQKTPQSQNFAPYGSLGYVLTGAHGKECDPPCAPDQKCIKNAECAPGKKCPNVCFPYTRRVWTSANA